MALNESANKTTNRSARQPLKPGPLPSDPGERAAMESHFKTGYEELRSRAAKLQMETQLVQNLLSPQEEEAREQLLGYFAGLDALIHGRLGAVVAGHVDSPPPAARVVARAIEADRGQAVNIAADDLINAAKWARRELDDGDGGDDSDDNDDGVRKVLTKRIGVLEAALPQQLHRFARLALMHAEHELGLRTYRNSETMLCDAVVDVARANFWVSEDGWAFDMQELADGISSNGGVYRNPLSKRMFSAADVAEIVEHPLGRRLAAINVEQSRLRHGVRPATVDKLDELQQILLADQSEDQVPSRQAIEAFLTYAAALPRAEQDAIERLRIPGKDSHTGQEFDCSIGESIRDGVANRICLHKVGDVLRQGCAYLRK